MVTWRVKEYLEVIIKADYFFLFSERQTAGADVDEEQKTESEALKSFMVVLAAVSLKIIFILKENTANPFVFPPIYDILSRELRRWKVA